MPKVLKTNNNQGVLEKEESFNQNPTKNDLLY